MRMLDIYKKVVRYPIKPTKRHGKKKYSRKVKHKRSEHGSG
jgi:hypothetical protein